MLIPPSPDLDVAAVRGLARRLALLVAKGTGWPVVAREAEGLARQLLPSASPALLRELCDFALAEARLRRPSWSDEAILAQFLAEPPPRHLLLALASPSSAQDEPSAPGIVGAGGGSYGSAGTGLGSLPSPAASAPPPRSAVVIRLASARARLRSV